MKTHTFKMKQTDKKNIFEILVETSGNLGIRARILGVFLIIISLSIFIVAGSTYYIGRDSLEKTMEHQLNNSVRFVMNQVTLLSGAYNSREFSNELNHVLTSENASFNQEGIKAQIYLINSSGFEINRMNVNEETNKKTDLPEDFIKKVIKQKNGTLTAKINNTDKLASFGYVIEKDWFYIVAVPKSSYMKTIYNLLIAAVISGIIAILLAFIFSYIGTQGIVRAVKSINNAVSQADRGNLSIRAVVRHGGPELRNLAGNFNIMISNLAQMLGELHNSIEKLSAESSHFPAVFSHQPAVFQTWQQN